jgi:thiol-disulfide isomerase/thioredoxin
MPRLFFTMKRIVISFVIIFVVIRLSSSFEGQNEALRALYFFSATCPHCKKTTPVVSELSKEYHIQGFLYGKEDPGSLPFPVKKGTKKDSEQYNLPGVPVLIVLSNGRTRQVLAGEKSIKDARAFLSAFRKGFLTVSEAIERGPEKKYKIAGWIVNRGEYFKQSLFFVTDRKQTIAVRPWLPLEAARSPFPKTRPRLMSDVIDKPVFLEGTLTKNDDNLLFTVGKELSFE